MSGGVPLKGAPIPGRSARPLLPAGGALVRSAGNTIGSAPGLAALPAACSRGDSGARKAAPDRRSRSATDDSEIVAIRSGDHSDRGLYANQGEGSNHGHQVSRRGSRVPHRAVVPEDYVFQGRGPGGEATDVRLSELFAPGKDSLVVYNMMFPRDPGDERPGPTGGRTAL